MCKKTYCANDNIQINIFIEKTKQLSIIDEL